jgi:hypothetical protein
MVCRSKQNYESYKGKFEVTMLLNTLYLAVMLPIEKRSDLHIKSRPMLDWLDENNIFNKHGNEFNCDDIVRYLRNGLAHFNIKVNNDEEKNISEIVIFAKNQDDAPPKSCTELCDDPKCKPKQFNADQDGSICTFSFTVKQLKDFTFSVIDSVLKDLSSDTRGQMCNSCSVVVS